jgi:hypothetical protein
MQVYGQAAKPPMLALLPPLSAVASQKGPDPATLPKAPQARASSEGGKGGGSAGGAESGPVAAAAAVAALKPEFVAAYSDLRTAQVRRAGGRGPAAGPGARRALGRSWEGAPPPSVGVPFKRPFSRLVPAAGSVEQPALHSSAAARAQPSWQRPTIHPPLPALLPAPALIGEPGKGPAPGLFSPAAPLSCPPPPLPQVRCLNCLAVLFRHWQAELADYQRPILDATFYLFRRAGQGRGAPGTKGVGPVGG